ncbi:XdhC family protein [Silvibacterium bohemicum]|nr:XdhC/CoxI family protein [Silvibacterium bohemicum]
MRERREIVQLWQQGGSSVLATLVRVEGSSYRQSGARLLLRGGGEYAGTISGGCLETEILRKAEWLVRNGAVMERYSTLFDDSAEVPFGLGCGGAIDVLFEPAETPECRALMEALENTLRGHERTILTFLPAKERKMARAVFDGRGDVLFVSKGWSESSAQYARKCAVHSLEPSQDKFFFEQLVGPPRLFVLGAGDDAKPLVSMAALMGWSVTVMDGRAQLAKAERFPSAQHVSVIRTPSDSLREIQSDDAVVIMTHSYEQDRELLASLLPRRPKYLGVLGARHRSSLLIAEAVARLGCSVEGCCEQISAPVGLDLGGEGPDAIALAVIAEIQACHAGRLKNVRSLSAEDVARHVLEGGASRYLRTYCARDVS